MMDKNNKFGWNSKQIKMIKKQNKFGVPKLKEMIKIEEEENPCWKGYEMVGTKMKNGKEVPNCVPIKKSKKA
tara:strand:+ start:339 stop:554 length:216 start_codon:yes stop_codon:yes gene_type:complete